MLLFDPGFDPLCVLHADTRIRESATNDDHELIPHSKPGPISRDSPGEDSEADGRGRVERPHKSACPERGVGLSLPRPSPSGGDPMTYSQHPEPPREPDRSGVAGSLPAWRAKAACLDEDPEIFFPAGTTGLASEQLAQAKAVCRRCPVIVQCLRWALQTHQDAGVWGGMSEDERRALRRSQERRRPD